MKKHQLIELVIFTASELVSPTELSIEDAESIVDDFLDVEQLTMPVVMESVCSCSKGKGIDYDEYGKAYCINCGIYLEQTVP